jgi:hypothetical protein
LDVTTQEQEQFKNSKEPVLWIRYLWPYPEKIILDPDPGSPGSEMNTKLIKFTISQQMQSKKNLI